MMNSGHGLTNLQIITAQQEPGYYLTTDNNQASRRGVLLYHEAILQHNVADRWKYLTV